MALLGLCKSGNSVAQGDCPAVYVDVEDPTSMVCQGPLLDGAAGGELIERAEDEAGVRIPAETVLRAAGLYLAERGRPGVLTEVEAYLTQVPVP